MSASLFIVAFRKPLDKVLKNVTHVHRRNFFRIHIGIFCAEIGNHLIEQTRIRHALYLREEIHASQNVDDVVRETVEICLKVALYIFRISL